MGFVAAKCTQCGANIQVDDTKEAGICSYCGTPFITRKAIDNYNTVNNYNTTNNYHADTINIYGSIDDGFEIVVGKLKSYKGSRANIIIPDTVKEIESCAFKGLDIESVKIGKTVKMIHWNAFTDCKNLKTITFEEGVRFIGSSAFAGCISLQEVMLPSSIHTIQSYAFQGCLNLRNIVLPQGLQYVEVGCFKECQSLTSITIPKSVKEMQRPFQNCKSLRKVVILGEPKLDCMCLFSDCPKDIQIDAPPKWKESNYHRFFAKNKKDGCYVATCVYGSYDCPEVWTLRRYRDNTLGSSWYGQMFIKLYYAISPTLVKCFGNTKWFIKFWHKQLDKMVYKLNEKGVENSPYEDKNWRK